jgi:hypothetical protein
MRMEAIFFELVLANLKLQQAALILTENFRLLCDIVPYLIRKIVFATVAISRQI